MTVRVLAFAGARQWLPSEELLDLPAGATAGQVRQVLVARHVAASALLARSALAVNETLAEDEQSLADGDIVAVLPPVSGG